MAQQKPVNPVSGWLLAAPVALAAGAVLAQSAAGDVDTSDWQCELCPFAAGHDGRAVAGVTAADDDAAHLADATGYDESGAYGNLDGRGTYTGAAYFMRWTAEDLLLDSRAARVEGGHLGRFAYRAEMAQIPHRTFITTETVFAEAGRELLTLPGDWVHAPQTGGFATLEANLVGRDIESDRTNLLLGGSYRLGDRFSASLDYRRRENEGTRILGGSSFTTASLLPAPFDYVTDEVELSLDYSAGRGHAALGWYLSDFSNDTLALAWESPFTSIPGAETPALAQAPESRFQQVSLRGGYVFDLFRTTLSASAAVGEVTQDSAFLPYTTNVLLPTEPLPRATLDGKVDVAHYAASLSFRPLPKARVLLGWRYDERDNGTARIGWNRVIVDSFVSGADEFNTPYSFEISVLNGRINYDLFANLSLEGGVERRETERDYREVAEQTEDTGWLGARWRPLDLLSVDVRGGTRKRDIDRYDEDLAASLGQNPLLRKYDLAYRYREFADFAVTLAPPEWPVALTIDGLWADDSYTRSRLGLISAEELQVAADLTWTVSDNVSAWFNVGYDRLESLQRGSESFAEPDWSARWDDEFATVGAGVRIRNIADKLDLRMDFRESDSASAIDIDATASGADAFPDFETRYSRVHVGLDYTVSERLALEAGLTWQTFDSDDWMLAGVGPATIPAVLTLGAMPYDEEQLLFGIGFRYDLSAVDPDGSVDD